MVMCGYVERGRGGGGSCVSYQRYHTLCRCSGTPIVTACQSRIMHAHVTRQKCLRFF